jgi:hypothetical protein
METSNSALRAELGVCLRDVQQALTGLAQHIRKRAGEAWLWQKPDQGQGAFTEPPADLNREDTLKGIVEGIVAIKYGDEDQDAHSSLIAPGIVCVSEEGIALADEVNRAKSSLARVLRAMSDRTEEGIVDERTGERGLRPLREVALEAFFFRRLNHWQATRRLEILREAPEYLGFIWATSRDVRRTSREELLQQAQAEDSRISVADVAVLSELPVGEPLALVRPGHTTPKVNIRWAARDWRPATTSVRIAVLPLILLGDRLPARLRKLPAAPTPKHFRLNRVDVEIEAEPVLQSLPVHRYLPHVREEKLRELERGSARMTQPDATDPKASV